MVSLIQYLPVLVWGVKGANFPAIVRGSVAIFWYGAQTYFASTAVALLIYSLFGNTGAEPVALGLTGVDFIAVIFVSCFQIFLFWNGIDLIRRFLNIAGPMVYLMMIVLMLIIWVKAGGGLLSEVGNIFQGIGDYNGSTISAFVEIFGIMVAYFAAVVINFGDFSRFVSSEQEMKKGNITGLLLNIALFSFMALMITAGTVVIFGEVMTNPTDMVAKVDNLFFTIMAAFVFFTATVGINMVANFIPPAYDLANLLPTKISFRTGGLITAAIGFVLAVLWVSTIEKIGIFGFVNTLGAILAPFYGIMVVDYYKIKNQELDIKQLFSSDPDGKYYYDGGWNKRALVAFAIAAIFAIGTVWVPALSQLAGYGWLIGAALGGGIYYLLARRLNQVE
jgi:NCS1 family nucleobase:cation symporter-1